MKKKILIVNGPNLNLLGKRRPEIYGSETLQEVLDRVAAKFPEVELAHFQSNCEGDLVTRIQEAWYRDRVDGIVINPGAYAHYSIAIADAIEAVECPVIEVHISNIHAREEFRHKSVISRVCMGVIAGLGTLGYDLAVERLA